MHSVEFSTSLPSKTSTFNAQSSSPYIPDDVAGDGPTLTGMEDPIPLKDLIQQFTQR